MARADRGRGWVTTSAVVLAVLLTGGLSACASSNPTTPSATGSSSAAASSAPAVSSSKPVTSAAGGSSAAGSSGTTTLTGTVTEGVESGCVVLTDASGAVLANLMGLDTKAAPVGSKVEVTGQFETDMMTTCQQGKPFTVTAVQVQK